MALDQRRPDRTPRLLWLVALAVVALIAGCAPKIGDKCTISTDCSVNGDRLCDSTQPGGYCTVFNCEPNACPDDSLCVAFTEPTCSSPAQSVRFTRTFCMATCQSDGDCRAGYACIDTSSDEVRQVVDVSPSSRRICTVAPSPPISLDASTVEPAVCNAFDASLPEAAPAPGDAGEAGDSTTPDAAPLEATTVDATPDAGATDSSDAADAE